MNGLVLIGGGGHCKSVLDVALNMGDFEDIVIVDPRLNEGNLIMGFRVAGDDDRLEELYHSGYYNAFISIGHVGDTRLRKELEEKSAYVGFKYPCIVDPSATVSKNALLGDGVYIGKRAVVNVEMRIGDHVIINTGAVVEHDYQIGQHVHVAVQATVCGGCEIGENAFIGAGATIIQGVKIGMNAIIGAGSLILSDLPKNTKVFGIWNSSYAQAEYRLTSKFGGWKNRLRYRANLRILEAA